MAPSIRFWDRIAERYAKQPVADEEAYQHKLEVTRGYLRPEMRVLEFGCGTGSTAIVHAPRVATIRAIDVSPKMIEIAQGKTAAAGIKNISFEVSSVEELSAEGESFDAILGMSILHLVDDCDATLAAVHRMLRSGGVFFSSTVTLGDTSKALRWVFPLTAAVGLTPQVSVFSTKELVRSLEAAGFTIEQTWRPEKGHAVFIVARKSK